MVPRRTRRRWSTILQLSGEKPEDYGFEKSPVRHHYFALPAEVYHFRSTEQRQQAFRRCAENYRALGLQVPPAWTFASGSFSPDGKYVVTGSGYYREDSGEKPLNIGEVQVWDTATAPPTCGQMAIL